MKDVSADPDDDAPSGAEDRASRAASSPRRSARACRRCSPCCAPSSTCSAADQDANLGLYGAFGYDLAFQFDPVDLSLRARRRASATSCSTCPTRSWSSTTIRRRPGTTATTIRGDGFSTEGLPRDGERRAVQAVPTAFRRAATTSPASMPGWSRRRWRAFGAATCSRSCPARCSTSAAKSLPSEISRRLKTDQPLALFLLHQSRRGRVSDRRLARDVRAGQRPPRRDLPDLRHDQARRRRDLGLPSRS